MESKVFSFDVFDTCLVRKCGAPENFFDILAYRAFSTMVDENTRRAFIVARKDAESLHAGLDEIYNQLNFDHEYVLPSQQLVQNELQLEHELLVPVRSMLEKVNELRKKGRILFISDMYLPYAFIQSELQSYGFFKEGDVLYVSADEKALKSDGSLFRKVAAQERISFRCWHHYGDNYNGDFRMPKRLGIRATLVHHDYSPYEKEWISHSVRCGYYWQGIMAGYARALRLSSPSNSHNAFVLNFIAPLYVPFVYRVMRDASEKGIARLYFCARDSHILYLIAQRLQRLFSKLEVEYLYISRTSLYETEDFNKIAYFKQVGLATLTERVAIVDIASKGTTQQCLNDLLRRYGYNSVRCYLFNWIDSSSFSSNTSECYCELDSCWLEYNKKSRRLSCNAFFYEIFFALQTQNRTIGYGYNPQNGQYKPLMDDSYDCFSKETSDFEKIHNELLQNYTDFFIDSKLYYYADSLFEGLAIPSWADFLCAPKKYYLEPLKSFSACNRDGKMVPYVKRRPLLWLLDIKKKNIIWKRGTIAANLPQWLSDLLLRNR